MNKQTQEALKMAIEALSQDEGWFEPEAAIQACKEALEQEQSFAEKTAQMSFMSLWDAYTTLKMKLEALEQPAQEPLMYGDAIHKGLSGACKPAQEYLTRAQQVIRANNSAREHCVNLKMDKCEHKNICKHCTHPAPQPAQEPVDVARVQEDGYVEWNPDLPDLPVGTKLYTNPAPQPAQEPVAWNEEEFNAIAYAYRTCPAHEIKMVSDRYQELVNYVLSITHPAPSWQGLSDDDMSIIFDKFDWKEVEIAGEHLDLFAFARAIEQALKEKNS